MLCAVAAHRLDAFWQVVQDRIGPGLSEHLADQSGGGVVIEPGAQIPGGPITDAAARDSRPALQGPFRVDGHGLSGTAPLVAQLCVLGPPGGLDSAEQLAAQRHRLTGLQRPELFAADTEQLAERPGVSTQPDVVTLVRDPTETADQHAGTSLSDCGERSGVLISDEVERRHDDGAIAAQIMAGVDHVHCHPSPPQRAVETHHLVRVGEVVLRVGVQFRSPPGLIVEEQRCLSTDLAALDRSQPLQGLTEADCGAPDVGVLPGVRDHRRVVLLGTGRRLPPLEEHDRIGAAGHMPQGVPQHLVRGLGAVVGLPVHRGGGVLHEHPRPAAGDSAREVCAEGELHVAQRVIGDGVMVSGDDVHVLGPGEIVHVLRPGGAHEVGGHRDIRGDLPQDRLHLGEVGQQLIGGVPMEVQPLGGVQEHRGAARRQHLLKVGVALGPECGPPRAVELLHSAVAGLEPAPEGGCGVVGEIMAVVAAELVVHVPQRQGGVARVTLGHRPSHAQRVLAEDGIGHRIGLARAGPQRGALGGLRQDPGVLVGEPGRRGGRGGGKRHVDPGGMEAVHGLVQPAPVILALAGFEHGPGEDAHADQVDPGLAHETYVVEPRGLRPLLGVVVASVGEAGNLGGPVHHCSSSSWSISRYMSSAASAGVARSKKTSSS